MNSAPSKIGGATVLLYAIVDDGVVPTGNCKQLVGGVLQGAASGLAICQYDDTAYYLFGCDEHWKCVTDTWHETLADAQAQAEYQYADISRHWQKANSA